MQNNGSRILAGSIIVASAAGISAADPQQAWGTIAQGRYEKALAKELGVAEKQVRVRPLNPKKIAGSPVQAFGRFGAMEQVSGPEPTARATGPQQGIQAELSGLSIRRLRFKDDAEALAQGQERINLLTNPQESRRVLHPRDANHPAVIEVRGNEVLVISGPRVKDAKFLEQARKAAWGGPFEQKAEPQALATFSAPNAEGVRAYAVDLEQASGPVYENLQRTQRLAAEAESMDPTFFQRVSPTSFEEQLPTGEVAQVAQTDEGVSFLMSPSVEQAAVADQLSRAVDGRRRDPLQERLAQQQQQARATAPSTAPTDQQAAAGTAPTDQGTAPAGTAPTDQQAAAGTAPTDQGTAPAGTAPTDQQVAAGTAPTDPQASASDAPAQVASLADGTPLFLTQDEQGRPVRVVGQPDGEVYEFTSPVLADDPEQALLQVEMQGMLDEARPLATGIDSTQTLDEVPAVVASAQQDSAASAPSDTQATAPVEPRKVQEGGANALARMTQQMAGGADAGTAPTDQGTAPTDQGTAPSDQATAPAGTAPTDQQAAAGAAPSDQATAPSDQATAPAGTAPSDQATAPSDQATAPSDQATAPAGTDQQAATGAAPSDQGTAPTDQATAPAGTAPTDQQAAAGAAPSDQATAPAGTAPTDQQAAAGAAPTDQATAPAGTAPTDQQAAAGAAPTDQATAPAGTAPTDQQAAAGTAPTDQGTAPAGTAPTDQQSTAATIPNDQQAAGTKPIPEVQVPAQEPVQTVADGAGVMAAQAARPAPIPTDPVEAQAQLKEEGEQQVSEIFANVLQHDVEAALDADQQALAGAMDGGETPTDQQAAGGVAPTDQATAPAGTAPTDQATAPDGTAPTDQATAPAGTAPTDQATAPAGAAPTDQATAPAGAAPTDQQAAGGAVPTDQQTAPAAQRVVEIKPDEIDTTAAAPTDQAVADQIAADTTDHGAMANAMAEELRQSLADMKVNQERMQASLEELQRRNADLEARLAQALGQTPAGGGTPVTGPSGGTTPVTGPSGGTTPVTPTGVTGPSSAGQPLTTDMEPLVRNLPTDAPILRTTPTTIGDYSGSSANYSPRAYGGSSGDYAPRPMDTYYDPRSGTYSMGRDQLPRNYNDRYSPMTDRYGNSLGVDPYNGTRVNSPWENALNNGVNEGLNRTEPNTPSAADKKAEVMRLYAEALERRNEAARQLAAKRAQDLRANHDRIVASVPPANRPYVRARLNEAAAESGLVKVDPTTGNVLPVTNVPTSGTLYTGEGFKALFPGAPTSGATTTNGITMKTWAFDKGDERFMVSVTSGLQSNLTGDQLLDSARSQSLVRSGGNLINERKFTINNVPARDLLIETGDRFLMIRMVSGAGGKVTAAVHSHGKFRRPGTSPFLASLQVQ